MDTLTVVLTDKADRANLPTPIIENLTNRVFNLKFATSLPGGFLTCTLSILLPRMRAYEWYERFIFFGINIYEADEPVWEGRISSIQLKDYGIDLECEGYWSSMADQTLYSWFNDNNMSAWNKPAVGAGGISDEISLSGAGFINKFIVEASEALFVFGTKKNISYVIGDKAVMYYRLPRVSNLADDRLFQPMTIHGIKFTWDRTSFSALTFLEIYSADHARGTWVLESSRNAGTEDPSVLQLNLGADGDSIEAVAIGVNIGLGFTESSAEDAEKRLLIKDLTIYSERNAWDTRKITGRKIITDLLQGNSNINVDEHAKQVSKDFLFIENTELELAPAIYEGETLQDIMAKLSGFGLTTIENLVKNPSVEVNVDGWLGTISSITVTQVTDPQFGDQGAQIDFPSSAGANEGLVIVASDDTGDFTALPNVAANYRRFVVESSTEYTFSIYNKLPAGGRSFVIRIDWFDQDSIFIDFDTNLVTPSTNYGRNSVTATSPSDAVTAELRVITASAQPAGTFSLFSDAAMLKKGPLADYVDGSFFGAFWAGTPNAASSMEVQPVVIGVYGRNRLHITRRDETSIKWLVSIKELGGGGIELQKSMQDFAVRVWTRFTEAFTGLAKFTDKSEALLEQSLFYDQRDVVTELGNSIEGFARLISQVRLEEFRKPHQASQLSITGMISNSIGAREQLWRVRAGDLIHVYDLALMPTIQTIAVSSQANKFLDKLRIFLVKETEFDTSTGELTIVPDLPPGLLDILVAGSLGIPSISTAGSITVGGGGPNAPIGGGALTGGFF